MSNFLAFALRYLLPASLIAGTVLFFLAVLGLYLVIREAKRSY